jgi:PhnB protein
LNVEDAAGAIAFYRRAFGATEVMRLTDPAGNILHAEIRIGDSNGHAGAGKGRVGQHQPAHAQGHSGACTST